MQKGVELTVGIIIYKTDSQVSFAN